MAHAAGDSHEYPVYGYHFRVSFPILDEDGDLVTGGGSDTPDSEVSKDSGTFADCTNELTEIATASGMYFLDLTGVEMTAKVVAVIIKVAATTSQTTPLVLYPRRLPVLETGTAQAGAAGTITLASGASAEDDFYNGLFVGITNNSPSGVDNQMRRIIDYNGSTKVATVDSDWGTNPSVASTYELLIPEGYSTTSWGGIKVGTTTNRGLTALPDAAADAAGGVPISIAGALDLDAMNLDNSPQLLQRTTVTSLTSQTVFRLDAGSSDNDAYINCEIIIIDATTTEQRAIGLIDDYVGATKEVTLLNNPGIFTIEDGDIVKIISNKSIKPFNNSPGRYSVGINASNEINTDIAGSGIVTEQRLSELDAATGGKMANVVDIIAADVVNIDGAAMRGTDSALLAASAPTNFGSLVITAGGAVDSLVQGYLNTLILESTAGRIAANFDNFYDNGDSLTTRIVDNVHPATEVVTAGAITTSGGAVSNVTLVATTTNNTDMRGTDSALLAASAPTNFGDLSITVTTGRIDVGSWIGTAVTLGSGAPDINIQSSDNIDLTATQKTSVNAEVVDVTNTDTSGEPGQIGPPLTASLRTKIDWLYKFLRNKQDNDGTDINIYADNGTTVDHKAGVSESGGTVTRNEFITGP